MEKNSLTLTVVANMTSNYGESLGNIGSVQKVYKNGKAYAIRTRESMKNAIMVQSGMYDDLKTVVNGATQKAVNKETTVANCRALEGGYMNTDTLTYVRNSSFYLTDAIACNSFNEETRFHNNLYLAQNFANANGINLQNQDKNSEKAGLMPYNYEYDKSLKIYSLTIDLEMIGKDFNFETEADNDEKAYRVNSILEAVRKLSLIVRGNLDNAEPLFIVGGLSERKTHYFENVVKVKNEKLVITNDLISKCEEGFYCGLLRSETFKNEDDIIRKLNPLSIKEFFEKIENEVKEYYHN